MNHLQREDVMNLCVCLCDVGGKVLVCWVGGTHFLSIVLELWVLQRDTLLK